MVPQLNRAGEPQSGGDEYQSAAALAASVDGLFNGLRIQCDTTRCCSKIEDVKSVFSKNGLIDLRQLERPFFIKSRSFQELPNPQIRLFHTFCHQCCH